MSAPDLLGRKRKMLFQVTEPMSIEKNFGLKFSLSYAYRQSTVIFKQSDINKETFTYKVYIFSLYFDIL